MSSDLVTIFLLSLVALANPTLFAAVTVMMLLPHPRRLMVGYLLGAYASSITLGLLIVFSLPGSSAESTAKHRVSPLEDIAVGLVALAIAFVLRTGRDRSFEKRRRAKKEVKLDARRKTGKPTESLPLRMLGKADPRLTFAAGAALSLPGVSYLLALDHIRKLRPGTVAIVLLVLFFCLMQQLLARIAFARLPVRAGSHT